MLSLNQLFTQETSLFRILSDCNSYEYNLEDNKYSEEEEYFFDCFENNYSFSSESYDVYKKCFNEGNLKMKFSQNENNSHLNSYLKRVNYFDKPCWQFFIEGYCSSRSLCCYSHDIKKYGNYI